MVPIGCMGLMLYALESAKTLINFSDLTEVKVFISSESLFLAKNWGYLMGWKCFGSYILSIVIPVYRLIEIPRLLVMD